MPIRSMMILIRRSPLVWGVALLGFAGCAPSSAPSSPSGAHNADGSIPDGASSDPVDLAGYDGATSHDGPAGTCNPPCATGSVCVAGVCQKFIDFETVPGGAPADNLTINTQFAAAYGVTFGLEGGGSPMLAKVGPPTTAFEYQTPTPHLYDTAAPGYNIGMFMIAGPTAPLVISYSSDVAEAYFQIIDIDRTENCTIDARDATGTVIDTIHINAGDSGTGDAVATPVSFKHTTANIHSIRILYNANMGGFAFDNFSPASSTPPPIQ